MWTRSASNALKTVLMTSDYDFNLVQQLELKQTLKKILDYRDCKYIKEIEISYEMQKMRLGSDFDVSNCRGGYIGPPICIAAWSSNYSAINLLIHSFRNDLGVNINIQDKYGMTALHWACEVGDVRIVEFLIEKEADPRFVNIFGLTPLMIAVRNGYKQIENVLKNITL